ncbi:acetylornithine deacetylase [endosymbiont of Ridgeia piscesae]|uniref:Acetylornithine deacetylase n=2 Tax=endosymbiont of Ridgeia piscesae TaxID=54398 RepID=A0A0T5Z353_9GAMM|nr:acetylornithine deacetylase [endosymbiont of Ridgeia piscesae]
MGLAFQNQPMTTPKFIELARALIAAPSVSSVNPEWDMGNQQVIEHLSGWLEPLGFQIEILPVPGCDDKFNLIASRGSGPEGLVISGHTDTVPFDEGKWNRDPLKISESHGRLYGLGSCDMKGFFAVVIEALKQVPLERLKQPLTIIATADEESTMCGAKALVELHRQLGRHAIIGEPTGLKPVRMHKGISMESVRLTGRSGHSSDPALGVNALEGMHKVIGEMMAWRSELQQRYHNPAFAVPVPTLNLGHIHGGDNPNRICGQCELQFDLRPLPGMQLGELRGELSQRLERLLAGSELQWQLEPVFDGIPALETPAQAAIVRAVESLTGQSAGAVAFGTEGPYLNSMGMETVICGPGHIAQAHQPDEYLPLEHIAPAIKLIESLIGRFCL